MAKNIVICCDGTGNEYKEPSTNVLKLYTMLPRAGNERDRSDQITYYDPGVGTLSLPFALTRVGRAVTKALGLGFGLGITRDISDAYQFLMETYEPGDKVYLFGFSRGAYTVRAVAAILYKCGLLRPGRENMLPYALKIFKHERNPRIYVGFKRTFSRHCPIHFMGLWDTVKSVGWIYDPLTLQFTMNNPTVGVVRQAIAIDERRCFYRQNLWSEPSKGQDVKQVWFAGAHADVGGGYSEINSGLSKIALKWMVDEAMPHGLLIDREAYDRILRTEVSGHLREKVRSNVEEKIFQHPPDYRGMLHRSLKRLWWIPEFIPKLYKDEANNFRKSWKIPLGQRRRIKEGVTLHVTVQQRLDDGGLD
ncbi:DUF2235 domain-containing protein [Desulfuromonas sp. TF]|uniref:DUF2235 domain-containing protein n=1 Tax=Desulfuromonas sp. TF TaxID=1232410 RepID=UPI000424DBBF|nr:DUF2235 domain-containing protein [Desulfuromonas sp. TF]